VCLYDRHFVCRGSYVYFFPFNSATACSSSSNGGGGGGSGDPGIASTGIEGKQIVGASE